MRLPGDLCCSPSNAPNDWKCCCPMVAPHIACVTFFASCWKSVRVLSGLLPARVVTCYPLFLLFNNCIVDSHSSPECLPTVPAPAYLSTGSPWCLCTSGSYNFLTDFFPPWHVFHLTYNFRKYFYICLCEI